MFVRVRIDTGQSPEALAIPRSALLTRGNDKGVYLVNPDQTTRFQLIGWLAKRQHS